MYINKFVKFPNLSFFLTFGTLASMFTYHLISMHYSLRG